MASLPCHLAAGRQVRFYDCRKRKTLAEVNIPTGIFFTTTPARLHGVITQKSITTLKMEAVTSSETFVITHNTTWRYDLELFLPRG
jgi:hypothetical protein